MMVAIVGEYIQQETSVVKRKIAIKKNTDSHKRRVIQIRVGIRHTKSFIQKGLPGMRARQGLRRSKLPLGQRWVSLPPTYSGMRIWMAIPRRPCPRSSTRTTWPSDSRLREPVASE